MHAVYDETAMDTARRWPDNNSAMAYRSVVELRDKQGSTHAWTAMHHWISRLSQMPLQKKLKNATYFAYNGLLWGLPPRNLTFLESPNRIGVKL